MATNRSWTPSDGGERQEETEYHRIVAWSKLADICSQLLYKGRKVYVEGRMQTRRFTGQDGNEREITEVVIDSMIALGAPKGKSEFGDETYYEESYAQPAADTQTTATAADDTGAGDDPTEEVDVDDIPF
jgi:single-strand DNA-binding protein